MARLSLIVDFVAAIRELRKSRDPDPVAVALQAELAGVDGITVQLREDRREIKERDVDLLREMVRSHFNLRIAPNEDLLKKAIALLPDMVTFVPDGHGEMGGLDVASTGDYLQDMVASLKANGIVVSVLVDPDVRQIKAAARCGADFVEILSWYYARSDEVSIVEEELERIRNAAVAAQKLGLGVAASGGLDYSNITDLVAIEQIEEVHVGAAILNRALLVGIDRAVRDFKALL
ncbi:MAG: pyridoxine 5'-phosphate synthase [candidate division KSB1 bacterium]|nr:pyridoxine 5'-phosphate synthase [candidate division KSB1 bacterium]